METPKQRYDRKTLYRISTVLHRKKNARAIERLDEIARDGGSRGEFIRQAIIEKVEREDRAKAEK